MNVPLLMAIRVQAAIDERVVLKRRRPAEVAAEERLHRRLKDVLATLGRRIESRLAAAAPPAEATGAREWLGDLRELEDELLEVLIDEVGPEAAREIERVERTVQRAARKQLPDELRPFGMDRRLFETLSRLRTGMLDRLVEVTSERLVEAAELEIPRDVLMDAIWDRLEAEITQLSRHALGDARNEATEVAERSLGVRRHRWRTVGDDDVRPAHAAVDGEVVEVGEPFSNGWLRPGGLGCRCWLEPVLEEGEAA